MEQRNIRPYAGQTYSIEEGADIVDELDKRTKHTDPKLNSIQLLAEAIIGLRGFTTQVINSGGNYNDLEVTADLLVFTNTNAQAILNGVKGRKEFHILNLSPTYEVRINHDSGSVSGGGHPLMLPTATGFMGVKGTARILFYENYGYFVADTWGSLYRPEYQGLAKEVLMTVNENSRAGSVEMTEYEVFRDAQSVPMSSADLNIAYPDAVRPFNVVCPQINVMYRKMNDNTGEWLAVNLSSTNTAPLYRAKRALTVQEWKNIGTTPIQLVAAPGVGKAIVVQKLVGKVIFGGQVQSNVELSVRSASTEVRQKIISIATLDSSGIFPEGGYSQGKTIVENDPLYITGKDFPGLDSSAVVYVTYTILEL